MKCFNENHSLNYLKGRRLAVFLAAADVVIPPDEHGPGAGTISTARVVDWALARLPRGLRSLFLLLLYLIEFLGLFFGGRFFSNNKARARERQLAWMERNPVRPLRLGFFGIKNYCSMGYYTREDIWKTIGYGGPLQKDAPFADPLIRKACQDNKEAAI
jgi:hypothetical protein